METLQSLEHLLGNDIRVTWIRSGVQIVDVEKFSITKDTYGVICDTFHLSNRRNVLEMAALTVAEWRNVCKAPWLVDTFYKPLLRSIHEGTIPKRWDDMDFYKCLNADASNQGYIYERAFSKQVLGWSKNFTKDYKQRVCNVLRKKDSCDEGMSDNEVLKQFGILTYNLYLEVKGPFEYMDSRGNWHSSMEKYNGDVLNTPTLTDIRAVRAEDVKHVMTIENKANFYAVPYKEDTLYIYTHGFMAPVEIKICQMIKATLGKKAAYSHFGDMDYGGIRIFLYLKQNAFPDLHPMYMDEELYYRIMCDPTRPYYKIEDTVLEKLWDMDAGELEGLKMAILSTGYGIEQETFI